MVESSHDIVIAKKKRIEKKFSSRLYLAKTDFGHLRLDQVFVQYSGRLRLALYSRHFTPIWYRFQCILLLYCVWVAYRHIISPSACFRTKVMMVQKLSVVKNFPTICAMA